MVELILSALNLDRNIWKISFFLLCLCSNAYSSSIFSSLRSFILRLRDEQGEWISSPKGISAIIHNYFTSLFSDLSPDIDCEKALKGTTNKISPEQNNSLCRGVCILEIEAAVR